MPPTTQHLGGLIFAVVNTVSELSDPIQLFQPGLATDRAHTLQLEHHQLAARAAHAQGGAAVPPHGAVGASSRRKILLPASANHADMVSVDRSPGVLPVGTSCSRHGVGDHVGGLAAPVAEKPTRRRSPGAMFTVHVAKL
jgi:hypothetical protein